MLRSCDLSGRVLSIERKLSLEVLGPTKTNRSRRLTLGATTAAMIVDHFERWRERVGCQAVLGDWVFAPDYRRLTNARADLLSHRVDRLRRASGVPDAALHRLRHSVGTHLVGDGKLLKLRAGSVTATRPPPFATTPTPHPSMTRTSADDIDDLLNRATGNKLM